MPFSLHSSEANFRVARRLDEVAEILGAQGANPYRVRAYRRAAETLRHLHGSDYCGRQIQRAFDYLGRYCLGYIRNVRAG